jgi:hypothetical protein
MREVGGSEDLILYVGAGGPMWWCLFGLVSRLAVARSVLAEEASAGEDV